jgi:hypothetical protein
VAPSGPSAPSTAAPIIHFRDNASYGCNAEHPETDSDFRRQLELLDGEPQWIDVEYGVSIARETAPA